jgi:hypothetical protein
MTKGPTNILPIPQESLCKNLSFQDPEIPFSLSEHPAKCLQQFNLNTPEPQKLVELPANVHCLLKGVPLLGEKSREWENRERISMTPNF